MVKVTVAVILPVYNGERHLEEQIASIRSNNSDALEVKIFAADDCSSDSSLSLLSSLKRDDLSIKSNLENLGFINNILSLSKSIPVLDFDFVALSDQDDIWLPRKISAAIDAINLNGSDCYSSNSYIYSQHRITGVTNKAKKQTLFDHVFQSPGAGHTFVIKSSAWIEIIDRAEQHLCERIRYHDWFLYFLARSLGYSWFIDPISYVLYRQHEDNVIGYGSALSKLRSASSKREGWFITQASAHIELLRIFENPSVYGEVYRFKNVFNLRRDIVSSMLAFIILRAS